MNLTSLQAEIGRLLSDTSNSRWSTDVLTSRINVAQTVIQGYTNAVKTSETLTPVANQATLTLNANTMDIIRVTKTQSDGVTILPLQGMDREELDYRFPNWKQFSAGEPIYWFYDATNQQINLVPKPDASNAITNGITVWESRKPADLVNSTDIPFDSNNQMIPYHMAIAHWVTSVCFMDDGTAEALTKSKFHMTGDMMRPGLFEQHLGRIMSEFDVPESIPQRIQWKPQGARLGYSYFPSKSSPLI